MLPIFVPFGLSNGTYIFLCADTKMGEITVFTRNSPSPITRDYCKSAGGDHVFSHYSTSWT